MKNFFAFIGVAVVVLLVAGIWMGWYKFAVKGDSEGEKTLIVETDLKKAGDDGKKAYEAAKEKIEDLQKKDGTAPATTGTAAAKPATTAAPAGFWAPIGKGK